MVCCSTKKTWIVRIFNKLLFACRHFFAYLVFILFAGKMAFAEVIEKRYVVL